MDGAQQTRQYAPQVKGLIHMDEKTKDFIAKLRRARTLIASGWTQHTYRSLTGCYCAMGAMLQADIQENGFRISRCRSRRTDTPAGKLIEWNDRPGRTKREVLAMFDNSIAALEARGV